jgi:SAM-dependent methyltransferase
MTDLNAVAEADGDVRYVRGTAAGSLSTMAHESRYWWASTVIEPRGKAILDFGCGSGYGAGFLQAKGAQVTGWDLSSTAISFAARQYPDCRFDVLDLTGEEISSGAGKTFDAVVSFDVIEHVEKWWSFVRNIRATLKDDGVALIGCPNRLATFDYNSHWNLHHQQEFTPLQLFHILREQFAQVEIWSQDFLSDDLRRQHHVKADTTGTQIKNIVKTAIPDGLLSRIRAARVRHAASSSDDFSWSSYMGFHPLDLSNAAAMRLPFGLVSICRP